MFTKHQGVCLFLLFLAASGLCSVTAHATSTIFHVVQCAGCNSEQMRQAAIATPGFGIAFVYNYSSATIRKYNRWLDSTCGPQGAPEATDDSTETRAPDGTPACGSYKDAEEMTPVDPVILDAFDVMKDVHQSDPGFMATGTARVDISNLGINPASGSNFSPSNIAYDYPYGEYYNFMNHLQSVLLDEDSASGLDPDVGDMLYGISFHFINPVTLSGIGNPTTGIVTFDFRAATNITLHICDGSDNCADVNVTVSGNHTLTLQYTGSYDIAGQRFPEPANQTPTNPVWHWRGPNSGGEGARFGDQLRRNGVSIPPGCGGGNSDTYLVTQWQGSHLIGAYWQCVPF
ncbi:MAG: hypothetical protein WBQ57_09880 [Rhodanobacteraceae bacterium]